METPGTPPTPEAELAEIAAERGNPDSAFNDGFHPGHAAAVAKMNERYVKLYGRGEIDPSVPLDPATPPAAPAPEAALSAAALPEGLTWTEPVLAEFRAAATQAGVSDDQAMRLLASVACLSGQPVPSGEEMDWELTTLWGKDFDRHMANAHTIWRQLPPRVRDSLTAQRLHEQPAFAQALAELGDTLLYDPENPLGIARMKARYEQALGKKAAGQTMLTTDLEGVTGD
jgi:hypothetical protein